MRWLCCRFQHNARVMFPRSLPGRTRTGITSSWRPESGLLLHPSATTSKLPMPIFSFRIPLNAGYLIYERIDSRGVRNLCLANYNSNGIDFELIIDLFPLETESVTSLDMMARGLLSAGTRAQVVGSKGIEVSGLPGFDVTVRGVVYDRVMPKARSEWFSDRFQHWNYIYARRAPAWS